MTSLSGPSSSSSGDSKDTFEKPPPKDWTKVGIVQQLFIYPLEGCYPRNISKGLCTARGLTEITEDSNHKLQDRGFVLYNERNKHCVTLADYSRLILLKMNATLRSFSVAENNFEPQIYYPFPDFTSAKKVQVFYHGKIIEVYDCGDLPTNFLSLFLLHYKNGLRLGMHCNLNRRDFTDFELQRASSINFKTSLGKKMHADFSNYLIIAQPSIDNIIHKIPDNSFISAENFRPNIILNGENLTDFPEDKWTWIKINDAIFNNTQLCAHTETTSINITSGISNIKNEPFTTLKRRRQLDNVLQTPQDEAIPVLGITAEINNVGKISIGDSVYVSTS